MFWLNDTGPIGIWPNDIVSLLIPGTDAAS